MPLRLDRNKFQEGHRRFLAFMERSGGRPFKSFAHQFFVDDEVLYKLEAAKEGREALQLGSWDTWGSGSGRILAALKVACSSRVSRNLLEHLYGPTGDSDAALHRVSTPVEVANLEAELHHFFRGGGSGRAELGPRFDRLADYLREHSLGCKWPFLAYLAFLLDSEHYFPILPGRFEELLRFYGSDVKISGRVEWARYSAILDTADLLREELSQYGTPSAIDIQSYMWVVSGLLKDGLPGEEDVGYAPDFQEELAKRQRRAAERERIGLLGEQYVCETERQRLRAAGLDRLAAKVRIVSLTDDSLGFDVLSFDESGTELHIEVKATQRGSHMDTGFWLSANEHTRALEDPSWCVFRVWAIDAAPYHENLGNVALGGRGKWRMHPASWFVEADLTDA